MKILRITWIPVLLVLLYSGWLVWRRTQPLILRRHVSQVPFHDPYGKELKILNFYAEGGVLAPGEKTLLCYGVVNATSVRLDPPVETVWPSLTRCFEVTPARTTRYTLTAEGADRHTVSESVELRVR